jgi:phage protein D
MDMNLAPAFSIKANDTDITAIIVERFVSLSLTDETGDNSDKLEIVLADHVDAKRIKKPPTGAEISLALGYDGVMTDKGIFVCDGVKRTGWPRQLTILAHAAPWDQTPKGKVDFQSHKSRSWKLGTTIGAMVAKMAKEHGMTALVSPALSSVVLPHINQSEESDMNLLLRLAKKYDAIAKPAGGKLIFTKRGDATTVSGTALPRVAVRASNCSAFHWEESTRESAGTVVAYYHATRAAKRHEVTAGTGEPVKRLKQYFATPAMALAAAKAELARRARGGFNFEVNIPGEPKLTAESILDVSEFGDETDGEWLVKRVQHEMSKDAYRCVVSCEKPNSDADVEAAMNGAESDSAE